LSLLIGVDAGGTKTSVAVADGDAVIARATGGPGAVRAGRALQAASRIATAVREALTSARLLSSDVMVIGAAGVGRDPERTELREALRAERLAARVFVTGDMDIALEAAYGGNRGIVLVSGTGSIAFTRGSDGALHRTGGYGWQGSDEGSGYAIGRAGLAAVGRARDGRTGPTRLTEAILAGPPARSFDDLVRWSTAAEPGEIASIAPLVLNTAGAGDAAAAAIVNNAADDLTALVMPLLALFEGDGPIPVALAGGLIAPGRVEILDAPLDAALGALAMARRLAGL
jgi:glucosamine kinase